MASPLEPKRAIDILNVQKAITAAALVDTVLRQSGLSARVLVAHQGIDHGDERVVEEELARHQGRSNSNIRAIGAQRSRHVDFEVDVSVAADVPTRDDGGEGHAAIGVRGLIATEGPSIDVARIVGIVESGVNTRHIRMPDLSTIARKRGASSRVDQQ